MGVRTAFPGGLVPHRLGLESLPWRPPPLFPLMEGQPVFQVSGLQGSESLVCGEAGGGGGGPPFPPRRDL